MTIEKVDLNFDAEGAFGYYFPTVHIDFVEISHGLEDTLLFGEETGLSILGTDPSKGVFIDGSFSIYFTKQPGHSDSDIEEWIANNLDDLYGNKT